MLYSEKRQDKINFNSGHLSPMSSRSCRGWWSTCTSPVLQAKDPAPSTWGADTGVGLARCHMAHMPKQNKEVHIKPGTRKKTCPAQVRTAPSLHGRKWSRSQAQSYATLQGSSKLSLTAFPNKSCRSLRSWWWLFFLDPVCAPFPPASLGKSPPANAESQTSASEAGPATLVLPLSLLLVLFFREYYFLIAELIYVYGKRKKEKRKDKNP